MRTRRKEKEEQDGGECRNRKQGGHEVTKQRQKEKKVLPLDREQSERKFSEKEK